MSEAFTRQIVTFGRVLREAGLEVGAGRLSDALQGLDRVDLTREDDVYWTLRTTLVARREEIEPFDRAFQAWFLRMPFSPPAREQDPRDSRPGAQRVRRDARLRDDASTTAGEPDRVGYSDHEILREKDFAAMTGEEFAAVRRLIAQIAWGRPRRRSRRLRPHPRGRALDMRRLARSTLATGGDPVQRRFRRRTETPRKLVVLCDVSGSMEAYTRAMLLYLHALMRSGRGVEVFAFGTRLTRVTTELATHDPEVALRGAADRVVDWAAGTRIGASLKVFNDVWGRRALTRGAVVVIVSDGWERDDDALLGREMRRLHRAAFAVVWVSPLKGSSQYKPLARGMRAALPFVDRFVAGHNLASLDRLAILLSGIERRHAA
ncbi:MAG: VWA domain-containing protein [Actinomycetota bacterium]|nr:VWA domain-containing protein [Actinomycetota bacterium]